MQINFIQSYFHVNRSEDPNFRFPSDGVVGPRQGGLGTEVPSRVPQGREVLSHRTTWGFQSHWGLNSTQESIVHGVAPFPWPLCQAAGWTPPYSPQTAEGGRAATGRGGWGGDEGVYLVEGEGKEEVSEDLLATASFVIVTNHNKYWQVHNNLN